MFGQQVIDSNSIPGVVASHPFADCHDRLVEFCVGGGQAKLLFQEVIAYARYFFFVGERNERRIGLQSLRRNIKQLMLPTPDDTRQRGT